MNFGQIETAVYDRLGFNANPDSVIRRQVQFDVNVGHRQILTTKGFGILRRTTLDATSVAGSPILAISPSAVAIITIVDRANNRVLKPISLQDVRYMDPGQKFTGCIPDSYAVLNYSSACTVDTLTPSPNSIYVSSTSPLDTTGIICHIEGITNSNPVGTTRLSSVALNGTTAVPVFNPLATDWYRINKFYLSAPPVGYVRLTYASGAGVEVSRIQPGHTYARFTLVYLQGIPAASQLYYCDVEVHVEDLANSTDEPLIPEDYHWMLVSSALQRYYFKRRDFDSYRVEKNDWDRGLSNLGAALRRRGGVSVSGQRSNQTTRPSSYNNPWMNG